MCRVRDLANTESKSQFNEWFQDLQTITTDSTNSCSFLPSFGGNIYDLDQKMNLNDFDYQGTMNPMTIMNPMYIPAASQSSSNDNTFALPDHRDFSPMASLSPASSGLYPSASSPETIIIPSASNKKTKRKGTNDNTDTDEVFLKKQKQNAAASRCRQKKANQMNELETQVSTLESEKFNLTLQIAALEQEKKEWISRESFLEKDIRSLQTQLDLAQRALAMK